MKEKRKNGTSKFEYKSESVGGLLLIALVIIGAVVLAFSIRRVVPSFVIQTVSFGEVIEVLSASKTENGVAYTGSDLENYIARKLLSYEDSFIDIYSDNTAVFTNWSLLSGEYYPIKDCGQDCLLIEASFDTSGSNGGLGIDSIIIVNLENMTADIEETYADGTWTETDHFSTQTHFHFTVAITVE